MSWRIVTSALRVLAVAAIIALGFIAVRIWLRDERERAPVTAIAKQYHLDARRPAEFETMPLAPSADFAADILGDAVLEDVLGSVALNDLDPRLRRLWIESLTTMDSELADARDAILNAAAQRPGWSYHWNLAGQLAYLADRRLFRSDEPSRHRWQAALQTAVNTAPSDRSAAVFYAGASLETWGVMTDGERRAFERVLPIAMTSPAFVAVNIVPMATLLGPRVVSMIPDDSASLSAAERAFAKSADGVPIAAQLLRRWESVERRERAEDLTELVRLRDRDDLDALESGCATWIRKHRPADFDDDISNRQLNQLLDLWPSGERGSWDSDPRTELIDHALNGRGRQFSSAALARTVDDLTGVPPALRAEIYALAGDESDAEELMKKSDSQGGFEWTRVIVELSRQQFQRGRRDRAEAWLAQLSPSAEDECEVRLLRADIEKLPRNKQPIDVNSDSPAKSKSTVLCVDPLVDRSAAVIATITPAESSLVDFSWDGARFATFEVPATGIDVRIPLAQRDGLHSLSAVSRSGGEFGWRLRRGEAR